MATKYRLQHHRLRTQITLSVMILLLAITYVAPMLAQPYLHAWLIEVRNVRPNHALHVVYAGIAAGIVAYFFFGYYYCWTCSLDILKYVIYAVALYFAFRWTIHDPALNLFRNLFRTEKGLPYLAFNYTGEIDGKDAFLDQLPHFQKWQYLYKAGAIILTAAIILLIEFLT